MCVYTHSQKERPFFFFLRKERKEHFQHLLATPHSTRQLLKNSLARWLWHCCFSHPSSQDTGFFCFLFFERLAGSVREKGAKKRFPGQSRVGHCSPKGVDLGIQPPDLGGILSRGHSHGA